MSGSTVALSHVFGLKQDVKENVWFLDDQNIVYPAGSNVVIYDTVHRTQKFVTAGNERGGSVITALSVSPNKRYVAVAEGGDKPSVSIFDLSTQRKKKALAATELSSKTFVSVAFSPDSKLLITQGGAPDWTLCYWSWEKAKVIASVKASNSQTTAIHQCSFNPQDNTLVCISGNGLFRMLRCTEGTMKPLAAVVGKRDSQNMLCHAWVSEERVVVGTDNGELLLFDMGEFKLVLPQSPADGASIDVIITCAKGFICGGSAGTIHLFEKTDDKDYYKNAKTFHVENHQAKIKSLAISPSEESLVCTLDNNQIIVLAISSSDIVHETSLEHLSRSCHSTAVTGLDSCLRKPIFATCATDRSVRIWNYRSNINELTKFFTEEAYSIAFHPSGYHILIGFSDKLRFMNLLMGDISKVFEFDIRSCRECKFSNGGQFFAAVHGNLIQIFSTYTFENTGNLRGHSGKVRTIYWTPDDTKIISAGLDGAVYEWNVREGKRLSENVLKSCNYTSAVSNETAKSIYAVGSDKKLKEIGDSQINKDIDSTVCITQLAIAQSGRLLFAGTETGAIRLYKLPLTGDFTEYQCHAAPVTRLRVAYDDTLLFSTAEDSTVAVLEIRDKDRKAIKTVLETDFAEEILIARSDIEEKNATINEMKNKYDELTLQHEYQMKLKELNHSEKMKELVEKMNHDIDAWKIKYDALVQEKNEAEMQALDNTRQLEAKHLAKTQEMDRKYQQKIVDEVERYHHLLRNKEEMQEESERHVALIKENHFKVTKDMSEDYTFKYREELNKLEKFREEKDMIVREFEETKRQMEEDAEHELDDMKDSYEGKLASERQATVRLKGENNVMKKRFTSLQKDIEDHKEEINSLFEQKKQLYHTIHGLEKEIASLKKEIKERDETIGDKEKRIYDLKKKNQELEKFKFVLDYKIKELKKQIEPLNQEITEMRGQIKEMDGELERYHKTCANQELASSELHMKVEALNKEVVAERQKKASVETLIRRMKSDLQEIIQHIQSPKELKEGVKRLYHKYMEDQAEDGEVGIEADIQKEYLRQREYLERTVASLQRKLKKDEELHRHDNTKIMQENMALISEINALRRELKIMKQNQKEKDTHTIRIKRDTVSSDTNPPDSNRMIEMQKEEIKRQRARIAELEASASLRPYSRERLPPMDGVLELQD